MWKSVGNDCNEIILGIDWICKETINSFIYNDNNIVRKKNIIHVFQSIKSDLLILFSEKVINLFISTFHLFVIFMTDKKGINETSII